MRIIAGEFGGRRLQAPKGDATRPTTDRAREALFARLGDVDGCHVLDLFAGSGALAFEALSRGAQHAVIVDSDLAAIRCARANATALGVEHRVTIRRSDFRLALTAAVRRADQFDLVFVDPPYVAFAGYSQMLRELVPGVLAGGARVVVESAEGFDLGDGWNGAEAKRYGATQIQILTYGS